MVALRKALRTWKQDVTLVLRKPKLVLSIVMIGFFMLWLASEQVRACLRFLSYFQLVDERHISSLRERYLLFGLFIVGFLWVNLMLLNIASSNVIAWYRYVQESTTMTKQTDDVTDTDNVQPRRRNAIRSCRRDS